MQLAHNQNPLKASNFWNENLTREALSTGLVYLKLISIIVN